VASPALQPADPRFRRNAEAGSNWNPSVAFICHRGSAQDLLARDVLSLAEGFIHGEFDVHGDLTETIRALWNAPPGGVRSRLTAFLARLPRWESLFQSRRRAADNIRAHYDRSNEFFAQFLDSHLVYSCAFFQDPSVSIEQAQVAKLDRICRKLDLQPGHRFLDVGCGWGALVRHAAEAYRAEAIGCTLSRQQAAYARHSAAARILECDYRDLDGPFDRIASVGMFEHVGRRRLRGYFEKIHSLLAPDGLFLNHGIMRPQHVTDDGTSVFLRRRVFPGGELPHLADVIRAAELAGFEVVDVENLRPHYALTCRAWVKRLEERQEQCVRLVGVETFRTWRLFLAASAVSFEDGQTDVYQVLGARRDCPAARRLVRPV
jgi:cyclopropane-fatty-acyl-phospholipid synthase